MLGWKGRNLSSRRLGLRSLHGLRKVSRRQVLALSAKQPIHLTLFWMCLQSHRQSYEIQIRIELESLNYWAIQGEKAPHLSGVSHHDGIIRSYSGNLLRQ